MAGVKRKERRPERFIQSTQQSKNKNLTSEALDISLGGSGLNKLHFCGPTGISFNEKDLGHMSPQALPTPNTVSAKWSGWEEPLRHLLECPPNMDVQLCLKFKSSDTLNEVLLNFVEQNRVLETKIEEDKIRGEKELLKESKELIKDLAEQVRPLRTGCIAEKENFGARKRIIDDGLETEEDGSGGNRIPEFEKKLEAVGSILERGETRKESLVAKYEKHRADIAALEFRKSQSQKCKDIVEREIISRQKITTGTGNENVDRGVKSCQMAKAPAETGGPVSKLKWGQKRRRSNRI